ncbi:hypothetical protein HUT18_25115 [Streptomyces sp. NA04227]|uniref:ArgS-related anticodon-binding protein NrtL n=1 Tax=Streptomyces sp. NA04227 TaxID=2742136 RepID=UPI0015902354|nr:DALR anticodon-binding domain-containing protein [Streptomyces sp. NA04227]QKW09165.1 hypothetical protein HUT18_25115 [Streptomyces sp. NA04227]
MTPVELSRALAVAVRCAVEDGELSVAVPERIVVERSRPGGTGDYASGLALRLAKEAGRPPLTVAHILRERFLAGPAVTSDGGRASVAAVHVTGPGFLNFSLREGGQESLVREVLRQGSGYGHVSAASGTGHGRTATAVTLQVPREVRAAVIGDSVRRILRSQGVDARLVMTDSGTDGPAPDWIGPLDIHLDIHVDGTAAQPQPESASPAPPPGDQSPLHPLPLPIPVPAPASPLPLGRDAARWALLHPPAHDRPRLDADLWLAQRESNPLFRVRYAYVRSQALVRNAHDLGFRAEPGPLRAGTHPAPGAEADLLDALSAYPVLLAALRTGYAPDRLCRHLVVTADAFFRFHDAIRVLPLGPEKPSAAHRARLALAEAAGTVLAGGLSLLGIEAPAHL